MKSEHRHELKTNELQRLTSQLARTLEPYSNQILIGLVAISVVAAGAVWFARSAGTAGNAGWTQLLSANSPEEYANVADEFPSKAVGQWARLLEAEGHLQTGIQLAFTDRPAALSDLKKAQESFEIVLGSSSPDEIHDRALYGLARTLETLSDGDTSAAIKAYERLQQEVRSAPYAILYRQESAERIEELKRGRGQEFYAWFHKQNPKPVDRAGPLDGALQESTLSPGPEFPLTTDAAEESATGAADEAAGESPAESEVPNESDPDPTSESSSDSDSASDSEASESDLAPKSDSAEPSAPQ